MIKINNIFEATYPSSKGLTPTNNDNLMFSWEY